MSFKQLLGLIGVAFIIAGTFMPLVDILPAVRFNLFELGNGTAFFLGFAIIAVSLLSLIVSFTEKYMVLWVTLAFFIAVVAFSYYSVDLKLNNIEDQLTGNPFAEFLNKNVVEKGGNIVWTSWVVLLIGCLFTLLAAALRQGLLDDE